MSTPTIWPTLTDIDIFRDLEPSYLDVLLGGARMKTLPAGTVVYSPETSGDEWFVLQEGAVELYRTSATGKRFVTWRILPGHVFGVMGLLGQRAQGNYAETMEDSRVCVLATGDLVRVLWRHPAIAIRVLEAVGRGLREAEERLMQMAYEPVPQRLAHFLLANVNGSGEVIGLSHEQIADTLGIARPTTSEAIGVMQWQGLVACGRRYVRILRPAAVEELAFGSRGAGAACQQARIRTNEQPPRPRAE